MTNFDFLTADPQFRGVCVGGGGICIIHFETY